MEAKLALLYLIIAIIITLSYADVSPIKHANLSATVMRIQAASEQILGVSDVAHK